MMKGLSLLLIYLTLESLASSVQAEEVTFCVTPQAGSGFENCSGVQECRNAKGCMTLKQYIISVNTTINLHQNVTLFFLKGDHYAAHECRTVAQHPILLLKVTALKILGNHPQVFCLGVTLHATVQEVLIETISLTNFLMSINGATNQTATNLSVKSIWTNVVILYFTFMNQVHIEDSYIHNSRLTVTGPANNGPASFLCVRCMFDVGDIALDSTGNANVTLDSSTFRNFHIFAVQSKIFITGNAEFTATTLSSAILSISSTVVVSSNVTFASNTAYRGAAMSFYSSTLEIASGTNLFFINNTALDVGGAIYIDPGHLLKSIERPSQLQSDSPCFFQLKECDGNSVYNFVADGNSATNGGDDIYGEYLSLCKQSSGNCNLSHNTLSVSSDPMKVCLCDGSGRPQCNPRTKRRCYGVRSGEVFSIPAVVVGADDGLTIGTVYAELLPDYKSYHLFYGNNQLITDSKKCTNLQFQIFTNESRASFDLCIDAYREFRSSASCGYYVRYGSSVVTRPVQIQVDLLPCLQGFALAGEPPSCDCYPELKANGLKCEINNSIGYFSWNTSLWIGIKDSDVVYSSYCPFDYCVENRVRIPLQENKDAQCRFNRAGILCGACQKNYSLATGSSECIQCTNDNNLALLIFFAAAGLLLVLFVLTFDLTVAHGLINGLIYYANVVWVFNYAVFKQSQTESDALMTFLGTFVAWVNLDFGIRTCFVNGLNAFWKTLLQFVFPVYIWFIALLIILAARYSTRLTYLLGSKGVPLLCTLFLLSYMKLLHIVESTLEFSRLVRIDENQTSAVSLVWSVDGNISYLKWPHILLFLAGVLTLTLLFPYTLSMFLIRYLRRLPSFTKFSPIFDAYSAPLKHKHHYWFGLLLLAQLLTFVLSLAVPLYINLLLAAVINTLLVFYMAIVQPFKSTAILIVQGSFLVNLALLSSFVSVGLQAHSSKLLIVAAKVSTIVVFLEFCAILLHVPMSLIIAKIKKFLSAKHRGDNEDHCSDYGDIDNLVDRGNSEKINETKEKEDELQPLNSQSYDRYPTY